MKNLDNLELDKVPFREEVPVQEFEKVEATRREILALPEIVTGPEDRVIGAELMQQLIIDPEKPAEAKLEAMQKAVELISGLGYDEQNCDTARVLIDIIRGVKEPALRVRLAAVVSHALQNKYVIPKDIVDINMQKIQDSLKRQEAFQLVLRDEETLPEHKAWAKFLLQPGETLTVYNELYEKTPDLNFLPRILEEIIDIEESGMPQEVVVDIPDLGQYISIRLNPPRIYTPKKRRIYIKAFGREPSLYVTRSVGAKYAHVEFPSDLSERISLDVEEFRAGNITRKEVFERAEELWKEFQDRMNDDQKKEFQERIEGNNLDLRFGTIRPAVTNENEGEDELDDSESQIA